MARINLVNAIIGVAVGGVDQFLEDKDAKEGRTEEAKKWSFWLRAGATAVGYLGQAMNWMPEYATPLAQSAVPLLTKSVYKMIVPSGISHPVRMARVASMHIAQTTKPEFEGQRSY